MPNKKKLVRRAWTPADLRLMKSMAKDRKGVAKIAKALKRSPGANECDGSKTRYLAQYAIGCGTTAVLSFQI